MAFLAFTSAQMDANSPLTETETQLIRTNFDDHEARISAAFTFSEESLVTDFLTPGLTTLSAAWSAGFAGNSVMPDVYTTGNNHLARTLVGASGAGNSAIATATTQMRLDITKEMVMVLWFRAKNVTDGALNLMAGLQDAALGTGSSTICSDVSDMIGFIKGTSGKWKLRIASGGASTEVDNLGTVNVWSTMKLTVTCSATAGNRKVDVEFDGTPYGPYTSNLTTTVLRPAFGVHTASGVDPQFECDVDYVLWYLQSRPNSA